MTEHVTVLLDESFDRAKITELKRELREAQAVIKKLRRDNKDKDTLIASLIDDAAMKEYFTRRQIGQALPSGLPET